MKSYPRKQIMAKTQKFAEGGLVMRSERTELAKAARAERDAMNNLRGDPSVDLGDWGAKAAPGVRERKSAAADAIRKHNRVRRETGVQ